MKCKHLKIRSRKYVKYFYCSYFKKEIDKDCSSCTHKEYKEQKTLKKVSKRLTALQKQRTSIIYHDMSKCAVCGLKAHNIDINEIFMGRNRVNSMKYGLVMPLCRSCHTKYHNDRTMQLHYMKLAQKKYMEHYNASMYDFINIFKRNYLD